MTEKISFFNFQILISTLGDEKVMLGVALAVLLMLYIHGMKKESYIIVFASTTAMSITYLIKNLLKIPRPLDALVIEDTYRFPSGHATMAAIVMTFGILATRKYVRNTIVRVILYSISVGWFLLISYSRLYLHVHYYIDIIIGGLIGILSVLLITILFTKHLRYYK